MGYRLAPPYLEAVLPTQCGDTLKIPFEYNRAVSPQEVSAVSARIKTISTNRIIDTLETTTIENNIAQFADISALTVGQYYKVQLAFKNQDVIGNFSTVGVFKYTTQPEVIIHPDNFPQVEMEYKTSDPTEKLENVYFKLMCQEEIIYDSGLILNNTQRDRWSAEDRVWTSVNDYAFDNILLTENDYTIVVGVITINKLVHEETMDISIIPGSLSTSNYLENTSLIAETNYNDGGIDLYLKFKKNIISSLPSALNIFRKDAKEDDNAYRLLATTSRPLPLPPSNQFKTDLAGHWGIEFSDNINSDEETYLDANLTASVIEISAYSNAIGFINDGFYWSIKSPSTKVNTSALYALSVSMGHVSWCAYQQNIIRYKKTSSTNWITLMRAESTNSGLTQYSRSVYLEAGISYDFEFISELHSIDIINDRYNYEVVFKSPRLIEPGKNQYLLFTDYSVGQGSSYVYSVCEAGQEQPQGYNSNTITADFEDMFLSDSNRQLNIRFNPKLSSFKRTIPESKIDTLGSQHPFIFRNGDTNYHEFSLSGLISHLSDPNELFIKTEQLQLADEETTLEKNGILPVRRTALDGNNITAERLFKIETLNWLTNGEIKLLRTPTEGNFLVRLINVSLTPNDAVGRMLHTFNATAYEVEEYTPENLLKYGFMKEGAEI